MIYTSSEVALKSEVRAVDGTVPERGHHWNLKVILCWAQSVDLADPGIALRNLWILTSRRNPWIAQGSCLRDLWTLSNFAYLAVSRGPLVGKRCLAGGLPVYFCQDSCLVYINFAHTQDHDYVLYLYGGTSGIVWTARFSLLSSQKMENEENSGWMHSVVNSGEAEVSTIIFIDDRLL